jgi:hypothetical protein
LTVEILHQVRWLVTPFPNLDITKAGYKLKTCHGVPIFILHARAYANECVYIYIIMPIMYYVYTYISSKYEKF